MSDTFIEYPSMPESPLLWPNRKREMLQEIHPFTRKVAPEAFPSKPTRIDEELKEYPLYREVQEILSSQLEQSSDPVKLLKKAQTAHLLSQMMNLPYETVFDNFDSIGRVWTGKDDFPDTWIEAVWNTAKASYIQTEINRAYFEKMMGWDPSADQKIAELKKQLPPPDVVERSAATPFLKDASQFVAQQVSNLLSTSSVSLVPSLTAAGATAAKSLLAGPVSVGPVLLSAFGIGVGTNYRIQTGVAEAGAAYRDMTEMGIEHDIAFPIALGVGAINSFIESAQMSTLLKTVPGVRDILGKASKKALVELLSRNGFAEAVKKALSRVPTVAGRVLAGSAKTGVEESAQEAVQEVTQILGEALGRHLMKELRDKDLPEPELQEYAERIKDVMVSTFRGTALLAIPGTTVSQIQEAKGKRKTATQSPAPSTEPTQPSAGTARTEQTPKPIPQTQELSLEKLQERKQILSGRLQELQAKDPGSLTVQELQQEKALVEEIARIERREKALQKQPPSPARTSVEGEQTSTASTLVSEKPLWAMTKEERAEFRKQQAVEEETQPLPVAEEVLVALRNRPFREILKKNAPNFTDQQLDAAVLMLDLHAQAKGLTFEQVVGKYFAPEVFAPEEQRDSLLNQPGKKAAVQFLEDGKALLSFSQNADFSSWVHEIGHVFRRNLDVASLQEVQEAYGIQDGIWTEEHEERFATDLEQYLTEGKAPSEGLAGIFERFARWLKRIYGALRGVAQIDPRVRGVLDSLFVPQEEGVQQGKRDEFQKPSQSPLYQNISQQIRKRAEDLLRREPSYRIETSAFPENQPLVKTVGQFYRERYQSRIYREGIGEVQLSGNSVRASIRHSLTKEKAAAFEAVPQVIQNGVILSYEKNWKGRNYNTYLLADVISLKGTEYICEVIVKEIPQKSGSLYTFYLHNVEEKAKLHAEVFTAPEGRSSAGASRLIIAQKLRESSRTSLYQRDPDIDLIREAVQIGEYVPLKVLEELSTEAWAEEEIQFRAMAMEEAKGFDSEEEFVEYELAMSPVEKPADYWEQVFAESRLQGKLHVNLEGNPDPKQTERRFLATLDRQTVQGILKDLVAEGLEDKLPEPLRQLAQEIAQGDQLSEEQYRVALQSIEQRPLYYKQLFEDAFRDQGNEYFAKIQDQEADLSVVLEEADLEEYNPDRNNREFLQSLDREGVEAFLTQVIAKGELDRLGGFLKTAAKRIKKGKRLTEGHFQAILKQISSDPGYYRELFAGLAEDIDELRRIEIEKKYHPEGTELQQLRRKLREESFGKEKLQKSLEKVQHELELTDKVAREYQREVERLEQEIQRTEQELKEYAKSAREEARKLQAEKNQQKREAIKEAVQEERKRAKEKQEKLKAKLAETQIRYRQKIKEIREAQKTRAYILRLIKAITRKPGPSVDVDYADRIRELQSRYEVSTPKEREEYRKRLVLRKETTTDPETLSFIERELSIRNLKKMTLEELEALKNEIDTLFKEGREAYLRKITQRKERQEQFRKELTETILSYGKTKPPLVVGSQEQIREKEKGALRRKAELSFMKPLQLFERLDGEENGPFKRILFDLADKAYNEETRAVDSRIEKVQKFLEDKGLSTSPFARRERNLYRKITVEGVTFTASDVMFLYIGVKNEHTQLAIEYGNLRGREDAPQILKELINKLTPEERALADLIEQDFRENYERLDRAYRDIQNKTAGREEFYVPAHRTELSGAPRSEELLDAMIRGSGLGMRTTPHGFLEERQTISPEHQTPIRLDLLNAYAKAIQAQEHYIAFQGFIKDLNAVFLGKQARELRDLISRTFGDEYNDYIRKYAQDLAAGDALLSSQASEVFHRLRGYLVIAYLAYNVASVLKQIVSNLPYLAYVSPLELVAQTGKFLANPKRYIQEIRTLSPAFKHRSANMMIEHIKNALGEAEYRRMVKQIGVAGLKGLEWMDRTMVAIGWKAVYEKRFAETKDAAEAARYADEVTARTQPSGRLMDLAQIYREGGEGWKAVLQFTQPLNVIWNNLAYDMPRAVRSGRFRVALGFATAYVLSGIIIGAVEDPYPEEDEEKRKKLLADAATGILEVLPIVGSTVTSNLRMLLGVRTSRRSSLVLFPFLEKAEQAAWSAKKGAWERAAILMAEALAYAKGLPASQPKRIYRALREGYWGELIGWRKEE